LKKSSEENNMALGRPLEKRTSEAETVDEAEKKARQPPS
jgi:hypothetical protein